MLDETRSKPIQQENCVKWSLKMLHDMRNKRPSVAAWEHTFL